MTPYLRYARIGWTSFWVVARVLLCVLWLRSYYWGWNGAEFELHGIGLKVNSISGLIEIGTHATYLEENDAEVQRPPKWRREVTNRGRTYVYVPHWFLISLAFALATVPWIRWSKRFSLRALLIASALIAVLLGVIAYQTKIPTTPPLDAGDFGR